MGPSNHAKRVRIIVVAVLGMIGRAGAAGPQIAFVDPTPLDGATIQDTWVEVKASIKELGGLPLTDVVFRWSGVDYAIYDSSLVLRGCPTDSWRLVGYSLGS